MAVKSDQNRKDLVLDVQQADHQTDGQSQKQQRQRTDQSGIVKVAPEADVGQVQKPSDGDLHEDIPLADHYGVMGVGQIEIAVAMG